MSWYPTIGMNYILPKNSTQTERMASQEDWLVRLENVCGDGCRVAEKGQGNAIDKFMKELGEEAHNGSVYRWIGVTNQAAYDIVQDEKRLDVLQTEYISKMLKDAKKKERVQCILSRKKCKKKEENSEDVKPFKKRKKAKKKK